ncbi:hypothetical protein BH10BAC1_BH10BAC1_14960 [soil metagenome]
MKPLLKKINVAITITILLFTISCGPSAEELSYKSKASTDSIAAFEAHRQAEEVAMTEAMKDSTMSIKLPDTIQSGRNPASVDTNAQIDNTVNLDKYVENQAEIAKGKLQHNIPSQMFIDRVYPVWITIKQDTNLADKPAFSTDDNVTTVIVNKLLPVMRIELIDQSTDGEDKIFEIKAHNPFKEQKISKIEFTTWQFDIKALKKGKHILKIQLSGCKDNNDCRFIELQQLDVEIEASSFRPFKVFFFKNWPFLFGAIIIPLIVWGFKSWRGKKKPAKDMD